MFLAEIALNNRCDFSLSVQVLIMDSLNENTRKQREYQPFTYSKDDL